MNKTFNSISAAILELNRQIPFVDLKTFIFHIDEMNEQWYPQLRRDQGDGEAQLLLLKISNLLVSKYECCYKYTTLVSYPFALVVDPANSCPLSCPGCVHTSNPAITPFSWPAGNLKEEVYKAFIEQFGPFAFDIYFANYGEPLLNKLTAKYIEMARGYALPTLASTSLSFNKIDFEKLVKSGLSYLILSIDGATQETYSQYRRGGNLGLVMANVRNLVATKKQLHSYTPFLHWQFLMFEHNFHEAEAVKQLALEVGVNQLNLVKPYSITWDDPSIVVKDSGVAETFIYYYDHELYQSSLSSMLSDLNTEVINKHFAETWTDRFKKKRNLEEVPLLQAGKQRCDWLYKNITMDALGRIMPCRRPPSNTDNLVFATVTVNQAECFNSEWYRLARLFFSNSTVYEKAIGALPGDKIPYCSHCHHPNTTLDISTRQVKQHLDNVSLYNVLSEESKVALADW
jgi:MoaA/NifB/PqqE/SkfB family radical SAM enzyme